MMRILATLESLRGGDQLAVDHVRRPMYLYPRLDEIGYSHETTEIADNQVKIVIRKPLSP